MKNNKIENVTPYKFILSEPKKTCIMNFLYNIELISKKNMEIEYTIENLNGNCYFGKKYNN